MKNLNIVLIVLFCLNFSKLKSQQNMFLTSDSPAKCQNIKSGKFVRIDTPIDQWVMIIEDNTQTEYYNDGKDYVKSHLDFVDDCSYKVTVIGKSDEKYPVKLGEVMVNRILETDRSFIKLRSEYNTKSSEFVLSKVEDVE